MHTDFEIILPKAYFLSAGPKVLVVNGDPRDDGKKTELIDLEDPTFSCNKIEDFPLSLNYATGGLVDETPIVCGGYSYSTNSYSKDCYTLKESGEWQKDGIASLNTFTRSAASGSLVMNDKHVIAGGYYWNRAYSRTTYSSSILLVSPNASATIMPIRLPHGMYGSCLVRWDDYTFMVIGGTMKNNHFMRATYFIHMANNTISDGPNLAIGRYYHGCHEMIINGQDCIMVTGGFGPLSSTALNSTEILVKSNLSSGWMRGKICVLNFEWSGLKNDFF